MAVAAQDANTTKGDRTRRLLLEIAVQRFARDGFRRTSVSDIAREAHLSPAAVYAYFTGKEALFEAAVDLDAGALIDRARVAISGTPVREREAVILAELADHVTEHPLAARVLSGQEPEVIDRVLDLPSLREFNAQIAADIAEAQAAGEVRADVDPETMANGFEAIVLTLLMGFLQARVAADSRLAVGALSVLDAALRPAGVVGAMAAATPEIDFEVLAAWMDEQGLSGGPIEEVLPLVGGTQNVLVRFERGGQAFVLRRGPWHLRPKSNDMMRREMRVLAALAGSGVPHPALIAACPDDSVLGGGAAFYLMQAVDGFNPTVVLPDLHAHNASVRYEMGLTAVDAVAALGAVDHEAVGLSDFGRPDGFLERQVPRWLDEPASYSRHDGYPGPDIPGLDEVAAWLDANRPASFRPGLSHGDYHLANLLYRFDGPEVAAIVDWEMCTVGDPLLDLGWLVSTWPSVDDTGIGGALGGAGGLPTGAELVTRYAERSTRDLSAIAWYEVMACFKLGIVLEGTHAAAFAGKAPVEVGDLLHATTLALFTRARARMRELLMRAAEFNPRRSAVRPGRP